MIAFLKAIPFGVFLTLLVCLFIGSSGSSGGYLNIHSFHVDALGYDVKLYWSWMMFICGTGLSWALIFMMGD